jgi:hypothetical protein
VRADAVVRGRGSASLRRLVSGDNPYLEAPARIMRAANLGPDVRLLDVRFTIRLAARSLRPGQFIMLSVLGWGGPSPWLRRRRVRGLPARIRRAGVDRHLFDHVRKGRGRHP